METTQVLQTLAEAGTDQNRKIYARHGAKEPMYGVSFAFLGTLRKQIKKDHPLAQALWATGNYDARNLALQVADPAALTDAEAEQWVNDIDNYVQAGILADLVIHTPMAFEKAQAWVKANAEFKERAGWLLFSLLAQSSSQDDHFWGTVLESIERDIHTAKNYVRDAMNTTLISIGLRPTLTERAFAIAAKIGKVHVDHGETNCKTPDAAAYIQKTLDHRAKKKK